MTRTTLIVTAVGALSLALGTPVLAQQDELQERVNALKASLAQSQTNLRSYEWIETTVVTVKEEEKSRQQSRVYYGAEGELQKVPLTTPPPEEKGRGLRGKIKAGKKEEVTEYIQQAVGIVRQYVPPDPAKIQAAKDQGRASLEMIDPGKVARLVVSGYLQPGDSWAAEIDLQSNRLLAVRIATFDSERNAIQLDVGFGALGDGTGYTSDISLNAPAKEVKVTTTNSGYRKLGS